jgi:DNA polymerase (family 10)
MTIDLPPAGAARNAEIAAAFNEIADLLALKGENAYRVRAYRQAARTVSGLGCEVSAMLLEGRALNELPGIGKDLAGQIADFVRSGHSDRLAALRAEVPSAIADLLRIPGVGPTRAAALHEQLHVESLEQLAAAARAGKLRAVSGFGPRREQQILRVLERHEIRTRRFKRSDAAPIARALVDELLASPGVSAAQVAGSLRRGRDEVGDIDLVISAAPRGEALARFASGSRVERVLSQGTTRASVQLVGGLQVDVRAVAPESFGAALLYLTGSKAHDIALRRRAQQRGMKLNEYGLFRASRRIAGATEHGVYEALGLPWIPPELREDRGELAVDTLPRLVSRADLRGDLHAHTRDSDGRDTLEAMAAAARQRGLEYLAITDHAGPNVPRGLDAGRLSQQIDRIDAINALQGAAAGLVLLKGVEVEILEDGSLDLPDELLARLDLVVAAVHTSPDLSRERQTARLRRAMDHPCFSILAHPRGREIGGRPPMDFDLPAVLAHARQRRCFVELDAQPRRLDLDDLGCRAARDAGVLVSIASDAHAVDELGFLDDGVVQARRGWLEADDVLNTRPLAELRTLLAATMSPARGARASTCGGQAGEMTADPAPAWDSCGS